MDRENYAPVGADSEHRRGRRLRRRRRRRCRWREQPASPITTAERWHAVHQDADPRWLATGGDPQLTEQSTFSTQYNQLIGDVAAASIAGGVLIGVTNPLLYTPLLQPGTFYHAARDPATNRFEGKPVNNNCSVINALGQPNPLSDNLVSMRILADALVPEINCDPAMAGPGSPYLLDAQERAAITARVDEFNSVISGIATARNWVYLDMNAFLAPLRAETVSGRHDRLRKCQLLPGAATAAQLQNAILSSLPGLGRDRCAQPVRLPVIVRCAPPERRAPPAAGSETGHRHQCEVRDDREYDASVAAFDRRKRFWQRSQ